MMSKKVMIVAGFVPMLIVCAVIFWFSSNVAEDSAEQSSHIVNLVKDEVFPELNEMQTMQDQKTVDDALSFAVRKAAHFSIYTLLGACTFVAFWIIRKKKLRFLAAWGASVLYAVSDEIHQRFVPGRSCELKDVLIDSCGALLGAVICLLVIVFIEHRKHNDARSL